jgi:hypothetical protein
MDDETIRQIGAMVANSTTFAVFGVWIERRAALARRRERLERQHEADWWERQY